MKWTKLQPSLQQQYTQGSRVLFAVQIKVPHTPRQEVVGPPRLAVLVRFFVRQKRGRHREIPYRMWENGNKKIDRVLPRFERGARKLLDSISNSPVVGILTLSQI